MGTEKVKVNLMNQQTVNSLEQNEQSVLEKNQSAQNPQERAESSDELSEIERVFKQDRDQSLTGISEARKLIAAENQMDQSGIWSGESELHNDWFRNIYDRADKNPEAIPWAELKPNKEIVKWLNENPGEDKKAIEMGCGLGDNAEAIAENGWKVTAFDISDTAIKWAKTRFPDSKVSYKVADLLNLPKKLLGKFDLVVDNHNLQAFVPGLLRQQAIESLKSLTTPDGQLLIVSLFGNETDTESGPPWPLTPKDLEYFNDQDLSMNMLRPTATSIKGVLKAQILVRFNKTVDA